MLSSCETEYFVLVHGATMGAWVWDQVASFLTLGGAQVRTLDLPAHGSDLTPIEQATMDAYVARVASVVDAMPMPVHLVGHSMGGAVISQYAELSPEKLESLIYLTGFVPQDQETVLGLLSSDPGSQLLPYIIDNGNGTLSLPAEQFGPLFCGDCSTSQLAPLQANWRPEPSLPLVTPIRVTPARFGLVPKRYIFTANDVSISLGFQQQMATAAPNMQCTRTLQTAHTPQLSRPAETAVAIGMVSGCTAGDPPPEWAPPVLNGSPRAGAVASPTENDWFRVAVGEAGTLTIDLSIIGSPDLDWFIATEAAPDVVLAQGYTFNNPEAGTFPAAANTNYLLKVNGFQGATGDYSLIVTAPAATLPP